MGYGLLAGFTLPTQRAALMLAVVALVLILSRCIRPGSLFLLIMASVLLFDPLAPFSISFWLSFTAVAVLALTVSHRDQSDSGRFAERESPVLQGLKKLAFILRGWGRIQCWLLLGMAPVLLFAFQKISLISPLANLVAVPVVGCVVVPLCLFGLVAYLAGAEWLSYWSTHFAADVFHWIWRFLYLLDSLAVTHWQGPAPSLWAVVLGYCAIAMLFLGKHFPGR